MGAVAALLHSVLGSTLHLRYNPPVSRRAFLAAGSLFAACAHKRAQRYKAWLFMASAAEKAVVIADLASFRRAGSVPLEGVPRQVLTARGKLYAICPANQSIVSIQPVHRTISGVNTLTGKIVGATLTTDGNYLVVATAQPSSIILIDTRTDKIARRTTLPEPPLAVTASDTQIAAILGSSLARVNVSDGVLAGVTPIGVGIMSALGYRKDGQTIFVAAPDARQIVSLDAATGAVLARLPVPIRPARFCVDGGGGQIFVTGAGREPQLVIFSPYQNQVDQTFYAGHALFGMAVAPVRNLLFLSNPDAGGISIIDIETRRLAASIRTGGTPGEILIALSATGEQEEYAFVVDRDTGDVSVIHIPVVLHKSGDAFIAEAPKPVFAVFHGGTGPQSAVILPYSD